MKFQGNIGGLNFAKTRKGYIVREKAHIAKSRILNDPEFARTRENMREFTNILAATKALRSGLAHAITGINDGGSSARLTSVMSSIKNLDTTNIRGSRQVAVGVLSEEGQLALKDFNFNDQGSLKKILVHPFSLDTDDGIFTLTALKPKSGIIKPVAANRAGFNLFWSKVDFTTGATATASSGESLVVLDTDTPGNVTLTVATPPVGDGVDVFAIRVIFYETVNGVHYPLRTKEFSVASILSVL